ncbi:MAG: hypothetical protein FWC01_07370 [Treponema sp.]|nr:hypothetical protein [Treponema sp.]MCL2237661.1 hypothetical protein [Treponema sp.]
MKRKLISLTILTTALLFGFLLVGCGGSNNNRFIGVWNTRFNTTLTFFDDETFQSLMHMGTYTVSGSKVTLSYTHFLHPSEGWQDLEPEDARVYVYTYKKGELVYLSDVYTKQGDSSLSASNIVGTWKGRIYTLKFLDDGTYENPVLEKGTYQVSGSNVVTVRTHSLAWNGWRESSPNARYRKMYMFMDKNLVHGNDTYVNEALAQ